MAGFGLNYNSPKVLWPTVFGMILVTCLIHASSSDRPDRPLKIKVIGGICDSSEGCSLNGVCIKGECHCSKGYGGDRCDRCAAAFHDFPRCKTDDTCYSIAWGSCGGAGMKLFKNEGLLPGRPKRAVSLVTHQSSQHMLGVQIVQGLWGTDTVSLKLCWLFSCGPRSGTGARVCKWENGTSMQVYIKNTGCGIDVGRKPSRTTRPGAGFKGECDHASARYQQICSLPSKRYSVFVRDVSWYLEKDENGFAYFEAANWRGHYIRGEGLRPVVTVGRPKATEEGFLRLTPLSQDILGCPAKLATNTSARVEETVVNKEKTSDQDTGEKEADEGEEKPDKPAK